jgi:hypothetical protein
LLSKQGYCTQTEQGLQGVIREKNALFYGVCCLSFSSFKALVHRGKGHIDMGAKGIKRGDEDTCI